MWVQIPPGPSFFLSYFCSFAPQEEEQNHFKLKESLRHGWHWSKYTYHPLLGPPPVLLLFLLLSSVFLPGMKRRSPTNIRNWLKKKRERHRERPSRPLCGPGERERCEWRLTCQAEGRESEPLRVDPPLPHHHHHHFHCNACSDSEQKDVYNVGCVQPYTCGKSIYHEASWKRIKRAFLVVCCWWGIQSGCGLAFHMLGVPLGRWLGHTKALRIVTLQLKQLEKDQRKRKRESKKEKD